MEFKITLSDSHVNEENLTKAGFGDEEGEITVMVEAELKKENDSFSAHDLAGNLKNFGGYVVVWTEYKVLNENGDDISELLNEKGGTFVSEFLDSKVEGMDPSEV